MIPPQPLLPREAPGSLFAQASSGDPMQSFALFVLALAFALPAFGQANVDASLLAEIQKIPAIDNHTHIVDFNPAETSASPSRTSGQTPFLYPVRLRQENPEWAGIWRQLYGSTASVVSGDSLADMTRRKQTLMREKGEQFPVWMLDRARIDIALVNGPRPGLGLPPERFRWVPNADRLLFPFGGGGEDEVEPAARKASLDAYLSETLKPALRKWKSSGAVAIKLAIAYVRPLDVDSVSRQEAERGYALATKGGQPPSGEYKRLQDYLVHELAREAGSLGLAVHIHVGIGADPYFMISGANPLLLESLVGDPSLRSTKFVLIHGGWPFDRAAGVMLIKPNVYADFSAQTFLRSPRALSETLRAWMEWYPEKILFGSDTYDDPNTPGRGWEELLWLANDSARIALTMALTGMMNDGQISRSRALELARMVLRENAIKLYGLSTATVSIRTRIDGAPAHSSAPRSGQ